MTHAEEARLARFGVMIFSAASETAGEAWAGMVVDNLLPHDRGFAYFTRTQNHAEHMIEALHKLEASNG